jgi:hypothetical protein
VLQVRLHNTRFNNQSHHDEQKSQT